VFRTCAAKSIVRHRDELLQISSFRTSLGRNPFQLSTYASLASLEQCPVEYSLACPRRGHSSPPHRTPSVSPTRVMSTPRRAPNRVHEGSQLYRISHLPTPANVGTLILGSQSVQESEKWSWNAVVSVQDHSRRDHYISRCQQDDNSSTHLHPAVDSVSIHRTIVELLVDSRPHVKSTSRTSLAQWQLFIREQHPSICYAPLHREIFYNRSSYSDNFTRHRNDFPP